MGDSGQEPYAQKIAVSLGSMNLNMVAALQNNHIDGLVQDCPKSIANVLELPS